jgi:N-acetylglucosamine-6-phosphate deacetylase
MSQTIAIHAGRVLTPDLEFAPGTVLINDGVISAVGPASQVAIPSGARLIEAPDKLVTPGFIDTHVHGRDGRWFGEDVESTIQMCRTIARTGTTSLLPTLGAQNTLDEELAQMRTVRQAMLEGTGGSEILGVHMEGPYLSTAEIARGSITVDRMRPPSVEELNRMVEACGGTLRKMSIAPELDGALEVIREMVKLEVIPSAAHSAATYGQVMEAVEAGLSCATHAFNGMIPLHHRRPGLLGAVLTCDQINAELIADGQHVYPTAMRILLRCKGVNGTHLITDNAPWAGLPAGTYQWTGRTIIKEANRAYVQGGTLAGSVAPMNYDLRNLVSTTGRSLPDAVRMASLNPAAVIGVADRKGSLEVGKDADVVIMDSEVNIFMTMVRGQEVYRADSW